MKLLILSIIYFSATSLLWASPLTFSDKSNGLETGLLDSIELIQQNQWEDAENLLDELILTYPGSRSIALLQADIQQTKAMGMVSVDQEAHYSHSLLQLLSEMQTRLESRQRPPLEGLIPSNLIQLSKHSEHVITVDLQKSRLYLHQYKLQPDGSTKYKLLNNFYISIGKAGSGKRYEGDLKTPIGIYKITAFRPDESLPKLYGTGAYTLNFPNPYDRIRGISGSGIWLHGIPHNQFSRPPQDSEGCVVMSNEMVVYLGKVIDINNTPVILSHHIDWVNVHKQQTLKKEIVSLLGNTWSSVQLAHLQLEDTISAANNLLMDIESPHDLINEILLYPSEPHSNDMVIRVTSISNKVAFSGKKPPTLTQYWSKHADGKWLLLYKYTNN